MREEHSFGELIMGGDSRWDLDCAFPAHVTSLLDVGCGVGNGFARLRDRGTRVVGVDFDRDAIDQARHKLDAALVLDIEAEAWPAAFLGTFDVITFADVLEHLRDPWSVLRSVRGLLAPGGIVVASVPNLRQMRVLIKLALGRWAYVDGPGIMAKSHLRFFTRATVADMFRSAGYQNAKFFYPHVTFHLGQPERLVNAVTGGLLADLCYKSLTVSARAEA